MLDTNGVGRVAGADHDFATEVEALLRLADIEKKLTKEHKVDYRVVSYTVGRKIEDMRAAGIAT